jgi:hypothetical protein
MSGAYAGTVAASRCGATAIPDHRRTSRRRGADSDAVSPGSRGGGVTVPSPASPQVRPRGVRSRCVALVLVLVLAPHSYSYSYSAPNRLIPRTPSEPGGAGGTPAVNTHRANGRQRCPQPVRGPRSRTRPRPPLVLVLVLGPEPVDPTHTLRAGRGGRDARGPHTSREWTSALPTAGVWSPFSYSGSPPTRTRTRTRPRTG